MNLTNRTRAALRARQREIEERVEHLEAWIETRYGQNTAESSAEHTRLLAEWDAIESECERRDAPQAHDFREE